ncbi:MAG: hypothetical protein GTN76_03765, partial [Candidatus Aenigmarchaeota archaeon]|nr:hypothetical protein [Candidatus Aenigmarchaeota archaeon]
MREKEGLGKIMIAVTVVLLAGCSLHKSKVSESLAEMPTTFSSQEAEPSPPIGKWWEQFEDKKLNSLMEKAFRQNLDIAQAYERLQQSLAIVRITDSSRGLTVNIDGSGGKTRQSFGSVSGLSNGFRAFTSETYSLSAAARYELDLWKRLDSSTRAAQFDAFATKQDLKALYISISAQLADLYYLAVEQRTQ